MEPMDLSDRRLTPAEKIYLLDVARESIRHGLRKGVALSVSLTGLAPELVASRASFVTLEKEGRLRGCIGSLEAWRPLVFDVAGNAFAAAFRDPRFSPVLTPEIETLALRLALLTPPLPMTFSCETDLMEQLQPGVDGLILQEGFRRSTFLPAVWAELSTATLFLSQLKRKAGLPSDYWSTGLRLWRYRAETIEGEFSP